MTQDPELDWAGRLAASIAGEVRRHRQAQGLSAQQLADRCERIGMPIQRSVLANLESGRRTTVNVAEVLVLAHALNVPPGVLIFPVGHALQAEVQPQAFAETGYAVDWLSGHAFLTQEAADGFLNTPLSLFRRHQSEVAALQGTIKLRDKARQEYAEISSRSPNAESEYKEASEELDALYEAEREAVAGPRSRGELLDLDRLRELREACRAASERVDAVATEARAVVYARSRARDLEGSVQNLESAVQELRKRLREQGLTPPLLPRSLSRLDPDLPAVEDIPEKRYEYPPANVSWSEGGEYQVEPLMREQGGERALISPEQQDEARGILEEMKPYLTDIMAKAMEEALRRNRKKGGD